MPLIRSNDGWRGRASHARGWRPACFDKRRCRRRCDCLKSSSFNGACPETRTSDHLQRAETLAKMSSGHFNLLKTSARRAHGVVSMASNSTAPILAPRHGRTYRHLQAHIYTNQHTCDEDINTDNTPVWRKTTISYDYRCRDETNQIAGVHRTIRLQVDIGQSGYR